MKINPYQQLNAAAAPKVASVADERVIDQDGAFNPLSYGGRDALKGAIPNARERLFNKGGQLNAWNKADALQNIAYLLQDVTRSASSQRALSRQASVQANTERSAKIAAAMQAPEGFKMVGQELLTPIKDIIDYEGWARKMFRVHPLAQGETYKITKDVRATAFIIGQDGQGIESRLHGKYIQPEEFKVASYVTVDITDIYQMGYDVLDRAQDTARQEIELEEDKRAQALLDVAGRAVNTVTTFASLGIAAFEDVKYQVERHRLAVSKFAINRQELSDIVKTMSTQVDPVTERELILAGYVGNVLNAQILTAAGTGVEEVIPAGTFYAMTDAEYMGEMGVRIELFSEPFDKFNQQEAVKGWAFIEQIGFTVVNPRAIAIGEK